MKNKYYWVIIGILCAGFIMMSLIVISGLGLLREITIQFIEWIRGILNG
jgi:putative Ca2+/H+ antiporter (TMEM165/GDT1 family)